MSKITSGIIGSLFVIAGAVQSFNMYELRQMREDVSDHKARIVGMESNRYSTHDALLHEQRHSNEYAELLKLLEASSKSGEVLQEEVRGVRDLLERELKALDRRVYDIEKGVNNRRTE